MLGLLIRPGSECHNNQRSSKLSTFNAFTLPHFIPVVVAGLIGWYWLQWSRRLPKEQQRWVGFYPSLLLPVLIVLDMVLGTFQGTFDMALDLPLHMCRIVTFLLPIMIYRRDHSMFGVLYFWVLAGTTQAILTPDIQLGFPSYEYLRYWILHLGLVLVVVYAIGVYQMVPTWRDLWLAVAWAQIYLIITLPINWLLNANYGYTMEKPPVKSVADYLGEWPWYILSGEVIMLTLFFLLYLPFGIMQRNTKN